MRVILFSTIREKNGQSRSRRPGLAALWHAGLEVSGTTEAMGVSRADAATPAYGRVDTHSRSLAGLGGFALSLAHGHVERSTIPPELGGPDATPSEC